VKLPDPIGVDEDINWASSWGEKDKKEITKAKEVNPAKSDPVVEVLEPATTDDWDWMDWGQKTNKTKGKRDATSKSLVEIKAGEHEPEPSSPTPPPAVHNRNKSSTQSPEGSPIALRVLNEDPYTHIVDLGDGAYGIVDKVERDGKVYARKKIRLNTGRSREKILQETQKEFAILKRLRHRHVIEVVEVFQIKNRLCIIMTQVADMDLKEFMERVDTLNEGFEKSGLVTKMQAWPFCLIQAIDYLHEMKVKHRDLKPANILIMGDEVLITDFGVSKDLIDEETTASLSNALGAGTPLYWAPEIDPYGEFPNQRRGRAVDIFALGCIFLEIATVIYCQAGSLASFAAYRETEWKSKTTRAYRRCPKRLLQWIWHLYKKRYLFLYNGNKLANHASSSVIELSFLMLDPNPKTRVTARQLVALTCEERSTLAQLPACEKCETSVCPNLNLPLHSIYKSTQARRAFLDPKDALFNVEDDWEDAKVAWLEYHMWW
jgi:serine/threonine protein kinase